MAGFFPYAKRLLFKYILTGAMIFAWSIHPTFGQIDTDFWFAIPKETQAFGNLTQQNNVSFKITAYSDVAHVVIEMPANPAFTKRTITVPAYSTQVVVLATNWSQFDEVYANTATGLNVPVTGKTNRGIHIYSDNDISAYYDYDMNDNRDLFALKGTNGLDTEFFVPFQNIWRNSNASPKYTSSLPYSSILIVAADTTGPTTVTITPPNIPGAISPIFQGRPNNSPFQIVLNKGETYTLVSRGQLGIDHPAGTQITSDKKVAVITNDDTVIDGTCEDIVGDQIVGTSIIGAQYVVMTGGSNNENIYVLATQAGTTVDFYDKNGTKIGATINLTKGQQYRLGVSGVDPQSSIYINANNNVYVWHTSSLNCQFSAAILPPITNCTGSLEVSFYRANTINSLVVNLMIPRNANPLMPLNAPEQAINFFRLKGDDGTNIAIPGGWFELNAAADWFVLRPEYRDFTGITKNGITYTVTNSKDFFHAGFLNGHNQKANKYGYFSDFASAKASAVVRSANEASHITCFGDTVFLKASGGLDYTWSYGAPGGPPTYLSDAKASTPQVFAPPGTHDFYVIVQQSRCYLNDTFKVSVIVLPQVKAYFETDVTAACAPFRSLFVNKSTSGNRFEWSYRKDNDPSIGFTPPSNVSFTHPSTGSYQNSTSPYKPIIYTYKLKASYFGECPDTFVKQIIVYPVINANFLPPDTTSCSPLGLPFRNLSTGNVADSLYYWNFGDGSSSPLKNPFHIFDNSYRATDTTYNVSLVATSPYYCRDTARSVVKVHPFIKAGFAVDTVRGCSPLTIKIYNTSLNKQAIDQYTWDFGDGTVRTVANDTLYHTYPVNTSTTSTSYKLLLTIKNKSPNGCPDTVSRLITVYPQSAISFTSNPNLASVCDSTLVSFTSFPSAAITAFFWDFGDGNTSTLQNPSHLFTNNTTTDKTYTVKLTGISDKYCNGYAQANITVHAFLDPVFEINVPSFCAPFSAPVKNKSRGGIVRYNWYYGDGTHDNHSVTDTVHLFRNTTSNVFSPLVKLVVTNSGGCRDSVSQRIRVYPEIRASFTPSPTFGCNPLTVRFTNQSTDTVRVSKFYKWDFNNGNTSTVSQPTQVFTNTSDVLSEFRVKLTVQSDYNCVDDTTISIHVFPYLEAKFTVDTVKGCSPFATQIHNASRGSISRYEWIYGDGAVDNHSEALFTHNYLNNTSNNPSGIPLNRYLKLIAYNSGDQCQRRDSVLITVYPEVQSLFSANVTEGCNNLDVRFTNQSGPGIVPVRYYWEFGDGGSSSLLNPSHNYKNLTSQEKIFSARLFAYSEYQCTDTSEVNITVYPFVDAAFTIENTVGCSPFTAQINNNSSQGSNRFNWIFDDGMASTNAVRNFSHVYRNTGTSTRTFSPRLIASYNGFCSDTAQQTVRVFPEVTASFTQDTLKACHPYNVSFINTSRNGTYNYWNFGDGGTSVSASPKHYYTNFSNVDSVYPVTLTVSSNDCSNSVTKYVTIYPKPKALFELNSTFKDCPPFLVPITNRSEAADIFTWNFGDGSTHVSTNLSPVSHVFDNPSMRDTSYTLTLLAESVNNCTSSFSTKITVYPRVIARFSPDTSGCSPFLVPFVNKSVRGSVFSWNFGDGGTSKLEAPTNKFFNTSVRDTSFTVQMIATSATGCQDTAYRQVTVYPQPLVEFSALPAYLYYPDARVNIDNQTNQGYWNYLWHFGDGQTSSVAEPGTHEYLRWGNFNIRLNVWNAHCSDSISHRIRVFPPKTISDFDASPNGCVPLTVRFTNHSTWASSYKWEFDDGSVSTEINPTHVFQNPGKYQVKLTTYGDGAEDVTYREIEVYPKPTVEFDLSPRYVMLPDALVHYYNTSKQGYRYQWVFGDGDTSSVFEPVHTYKELGNYDVTLNVWTEHQCFDTKTMREAIKVDGKGILTFPNAFKPSIEGPNGGKYSYPDTKNTVFHPYHDGVAEYKLEIYDRWGELLFVSEDVNIGWDGYYKRELCKSDVYIWKVKGRFYNGSSFNKAGDVTLLK